VTLSRKGAKSRTHGCNLPSSKTKERARIASSHESQAALVKKLKASARDLEKKLAARTRELSEARDHLAEALEQQTVTSEVLKVISSSPGDLEPIFRAMLKNATRICGAKFGVLFRFEGGFFHPAALLDVPPAFADFLARQGSFAPVPGRLFGRLSKTKRVIQVVDRATEPTQGNHAFPHSETIRDLPVRCAQGAGVRTSKVWKRQIIPAGNRLQNRRVVSQSVTGMSAMRRAPLAHQLIGVF
jgi:hypothetical protein